MMFNLRSAAIAAAFVVGAAGAANASTIIEGFDSLGGGPQASYSSQGFTYTPAKGPNGQCFSGQCLQEYDGPDAKDFPDGTVTTITEDSPPGDGVFDLLGFYLNFNGKVADGTNFLEISDGTNSVFLKVLTAITAADPFELFNLDGTTATQFTQDSTGYFVRFKDDFFDDVSSVSFTALTKGSVRLDCVALSTGGTDITSGDLTSCEANVNVVPLPAAGWLLLAGVGGLVAMRRKKAA